MRKILLVLLVLMTLALSGCSSKINIELYYKVEVIRKNISLDTNVLYRNEFILKGDESLVLTEYLLSYEKFTFKPIILYLFCSYDGCKRISIDEFIKIHQSY